MLNVKIGHAGLDSPARPFISSHSRHIHDHINTKSYTRMFPYLSNILLCIRARNTTTDNANVLLCVAFNHTTLINIITENLLLNGFQTKLIEYVYQRSGWKTFKYIQSVSERERESDRKKEKRIIITSLQWNPDNYECYLFSFLDINQIGSEKLWLQFYLNICKLHHLS